MATKKVTHELTFDELVAEARARDPNWDKLGALIEARITALDTASHARGPQALSIECGPTPIA